MEGKLDLGLPKIFPFAKGEMVGAFYNKDVLGGKGAALCLMARQGLNVPPGFIITTETCNQYRSLGTHDKFAFIDALMTEVIPFLGDLENKFDYAPLVSVRSGAPVSMPGMMDTILNVGLTDDNQAQWEKRIGERATADSKRRLVQMLGATAYHVPAEVFEFQLAKIKKQFGAASDTDLTTEGLQHVFHAYCEAFKANTGFALPSNSAKDQLRAAIVAVFDSWSNPRAIEYRKINKISESMGTAVTVQAMVFGNMGEDSGTGVLFTRDPSTGEAGMMGEFLTNAQGEDVVAGVRTPVNVTKMAALGPAWAETHKELLALCGTLEDSYLDMVDIEFTVQQGELFVLQSRAGKRSARAAFKIAFDLVAQGVINKKEALQRLTREQFKTVRRPNVDPSFAVKANAKGLPACPGVAVGRPVFSSKEVLEATDAVILVTHETDPNDIAGMAKAAGVLTKTGGATSHAAVVARAMDKVCVVGCTELDIEALKAKAKSGLVTICGSTGRVWFGVDVPVIDAASDVSVNVVMDWCLTDFGAVETAATPLDSGKPHVIRLAYTWGNAVVLDSIIAELASLPSRAHVLLDVRNPSEFLNAADRLLADCFGTKVDGSGFELTVRSRLTKAKDALVGLRVIAAKNPVPGLMWIDPAGVKAVPAEYATFSILSA